MGVLLETRVGITNARSDFLVLGGGIAGLAIAELLQRSGASVVLLEKNETLCSEASAEQQGWFHTGALYTALPGNFFCRTLVGNLDDLIDYYSVFPNMNLRVDKHIYTADREGWFSNRTNFYMYADRKSVGWQWKLPWIIALHRAKRRMSWFEMLDASRSLSHQMGFGSKPIRSVVHASPIDVNLPTSAFTLKSRDRAMNTRLIATDLLRSYLSCGGVVKTNVIAKSVDHNQVTATNNAGEAETFQARHIILAAGKNCHLFSDEIKVFTSPLLVVSPALTDINFVNMSPHVEQTINHIYHQYDGIDYSVIGNASYHDAQTATPEFMRRATSKLFALAKKLFPGLEQAPAAVFYGYKTELTRSSSIRNYLYHIRDYENYTLALPGKFSLCFSLAANVCRHFGIEPVSCTRMLQDIVVEQLIELPRHFQIARQLAFEAHKQRADTSETDRRSTERSVHAAAALKNKAARD
jgi:glycine/D-amino acid oxidase-like deaminating enzyme